MVHEKTLELYRKAGFEYRPTTEDYVKEQFERRTAASKESRRYSIDQIYRVRQGTQDYVVYNQTTLAQDMPGNTITVPETVGTHKEPTFSMRYDSETGQAAAAAISGERVVYDIPATPENLQKVLDKDTEGTDTVFTLADGSAKYNGFTREEFITKHFDDLLLRATTGVYPAQAKPFGSKEAEEKEDKDKDEAKAGEKIVGEGKRIMKEIKKGLVAETEEGSQEEKEYEKLSKKLNEDLGLKPIGADDDYSKDNEEREQDREPKEEEEDKQQQQQQQPKRKTIFGRKTARK